VTVSSVSHISFTIVHVNKVILCRACLVLRWMTVCRYTSSCVTNQSGQLSLLPSAGWEMSTGQSVVTLCSRGVKAGWLIPLVDKRVGGR